MNAHATDSLSPMTVVRGLCAAAAMVLTLGIVYGLGGLADHCSAATMAKAPAAIVVASVR
ncbi:MAG: hypothetical protein U1E89_03100 [Burkholderiaceae bacterium]